MDHYEEHMRETFRVYQELWQAEALRTVKEPEKPLQWHCPMRMDDYIKDRRLVDQGPTKEERDQKAAETYWRLVT